LGEEVVDIGLVEAEFAAVGEEEGFFGVAAGLSGVAGDAVPAGPGEEDTGLELKAVDAAAAGEGVGEVGFSFGWGEMVEGGAEEPLGLDDVALKVLGVGEGAGFAGGGEGGLAVGHEECALGSVGPDDAFQLGTFEAVEGVEGGVQLGGGLAPILFT
jgi:hypothetical protein